MELAEIRPKGQLPACMNLCHLPSCCSAAPPSPSPGSPGCGHAPNARAAPPSHSHCASSDPLSSCTESQDHPSLTCSSAMLTEFHAGTWGPGIKFSHCPCLRATIRLAKGSQFPTGSAMAEVSESSVDLEEEAPMFLRKVGSQGRLHGGGTTGSGPSQVLRALLRAPGASKALLVQRVRGHRNLGCHLGKMF